MPDDTTSGTTLGTRRPSPWRSRFATRTYVAGIFWAAGAALSWLTGAPDMAGVLRVRLDAVGLLYLASSVAGGLNFFGAGWRAARTLKLDMNFLMSAAIIAAIAVGEPFEAATIAFLFSFAELLERFAVDRGRRAITRLLELAPDEAELVSADGTTTRVAVSTLTAGDRVRVRPGERIPADARVIDGISAVNEATITGESLPRTKRAGDAVFAGTINAEGSLDLEVTADASHSTLARIVQIVRAAEARRAPIEHAVQRFARVYTPVVTVLALIVMFVPPLLMSRDALEWFIRGVTLLVIACPCALVIATPVTVVSALTNAARHGVLIKGGEYLEALGSVRALAIDKTGTLTKGVLEVVAFDTSDGDTRGDLLARIASLEARSEHPVARAIVAYAVANRSAPSAPVEAFVAKPGLGIQGRVSGVDLVVGTEELVGADAAAALGSPEPGSLRVYAVSSRGERASFVLRDEIRSSSRAMVAELHGAGIRPIVMLTGDTAATGDLVGRELGVDEVRARLLPEEKVAAVRELRARHGAVAMIGDGVNDAPALAEATVGLAMGAAASPATIETADIALTGDDLSKFPYAVKLARRTRHAIRFNIAVAIALKVVLAAGAVMGLVSLAVAVLVGDMGGSLAVTLNALRIARHRPAARTAR